MARHIIGDLVAPEEDLLHKPGPEFDWRESYWFGYYDPVSTVGYMSLSRVYPNRGHSELWFLLTHKGKVIFDGTQLNVPVVPGTRDRLTCGPLTVTCLVPLRTFRLRYKSDDVDMDVIWDACIPAYSSGKPFPGGWALHLEQAATVTGTVKVGGERMDVKQGLGFRDHTSGGTGKPFGVYGRWYWIVGQVGDTFAFNGVRHYVKESGEEKRHSFVYEDQKLQKSWMSECEVFTDSTDTEPVGCRLRLRNVETNKIYDIEGEVLVNCPVNYDYVRINDAITRYKIGDQTAYGCLEFGFVRTPGKA